MFAVIENGSRQHRVEEGQTLSIDYRSDLKAGDAVTFDRIFAAGTEENGVIGQPVIDGATVTAEVVIAEEKGPKLEIQKIQRKFKLAAVIIPPIPPLLVGLIVFTRRRLREREGISKDRRLK